MDVPFISSGAMSRAQYALVRNVENADSPQAADQILLNELDVIRRTLQQRHLSIKQCKENLILILHCTMSLSTTGPGDLEFAFPHAVNLAELGQSPMDKRIGYIFCMELMPPNHELQLMLVNTLRKDLESTSIARICLALDVLIQVPNEDVVPAVDTRLQTLLQHQSIAVRRRALMACYILFQQDTERLARLEDWIQRYLRAEPSEFASISIAAGKFKHSTSLGKLLNSQLQRRYRESGEPSSVSAILRTLRRCETGLEPGSVPVVLDIIIQASEAPMRDLLREAFMLLSTVSPEALREYRSSSSAIISIRHFLSSGHPNDVYLFVSCLSCLDPSIWTGAHPNTVAILDEREVHGIMRLLDSPDGLIRKTTLKILHAVDPAIIETYYSQALHNLSPSLSLSERNEYVSRLLEIINMEEADDIDQYARRLRDLLSVVEGPEYGRTTDLLVLDLSVHQILNGIRERETSSRISCVTALAVSLTEPEIRVGPTLMVIISALVSEHCGKVSISPTEMLRGIASRLESYVSSVQDACILTMLRLSVECDEIAEEVTVVVRRLSQSAGTHLRRRCDQFLTLSTQRRVLSEIVSKAPSSSLPDFLYALTNYQSSPNTTSLQSPRTPSSPGRQDSLELSPSRRVASGRKLRYEAYAAPQPTPSFRYLSSPRRSKGSVSGSEGSIRSSSRASTSNQSNELAETITPGELTLAVAQNPFNAPQVRITRRFLGQWFKRKQISRTTELMIQSSQDDLASRVDLITLDSPFIAESTEEASADADADFKVVWDSLENVNVRGWCEASLDMIVRLLQSLEYRMKVIATDQPPFEGELKVLVQGPGHGQHAALRLREGEDESCLWRLRCDDVDLRTSIKRLLEDI